MLPGLWEGTPENNMAEKAAYFLLTSAGIEKNEKYAGIFLIDRF
jgi:hypothetical protein